MLLSFYFIISIIYVQKINTFTLNYNKGNAKSMEFNIRNGSEIVRNESMVLEKKSTFRTILNLTKTPNLKYNIFDKMLSNEMLSIKHHLFVKNSTLASSVYISLQNNVPTPTLELKQKWPIDKLFSNANLGRYTDVTKSKQSDLTKGITEISISEDLDTEFDFDNKNEEYNPISKVIEVRSFSVMPFHYTNNLQLKSRCTCMKTNQDTICRQHCTATGNYPHFQQICTSSDKYINCQSECTRNNLNIMSSTLYPYGYPSYFLGIPTQPPNIYYHPEVINELKVPKYNHRYTNKPSYNQEFEDDEELKEYNSVYLENEKVDYEDISATEYENKKKRKHKKLHSDKLNSGLFEVMAKDKFIDEVVEDLKAYYSDTAIKDCYCSLSTFSLKIKILYIIFTLLVIYIM